jgi:hypothetical protein
MTKNKHERPAKPMKSADHNKQMQQPKPDHHLKKTTRGRLQIQAAGTRKKG